MMNEPGSIRLPPGISRLPIINRLAMLRCSSSAALQQSICGFHSERTSRVRNNILETLSAH